MTEILIGLAAAALLAVFAVVLRLSGQPVEDLADPSPSPWTDGLHDVFEEEL